MDANGSAGRLPLPAESALNLGADYATGATLVQVRRSD
jgi:hypothetical protein